MAQTSPQMRLETVEPPKPVCSYVTRWHHAVPMLSLKPRHRDPCRRPARRTKRQPHSHRLSPSREFWLPLCLKGPDALCIILTVIDDTPQPLDTLKTPRAHRVSA